MSELGRDEWEGWMRLLREDIRGVHDRLDALNGRTRASELRIAVLQDRSDAVVDPAARWGAVGSGIGALLAGALAWFHK